MANLMMLFNEWRFRWQQRMRHARLRHLQGQIEDAQAECAALGVYIGVLISEKAALEARAYHELAGDETRPQPSVGR